MGEWRSRLVGGAWRAHGLLAAGMGTAVVALPARALAAEESTASPIEMHGFVSQGFIKTTNNNYLANSQKGSFEFSEVGLNFTKSLSDRLRVGMQLFARDLGPAGNYKPQFDWYYLDYRFADWLGIRAGRTKLPFGLYNEINDVDSARVPILLPQSIYPIANSEFLLAQTGAEVYGNFRLGGAGKLEYRGYGGTIYLDTSTSSTLTNLQVPYVVGGRLMWSTPLEGLTLGGTLQALRLDFDTVFAPESVTALKTAKLVPANFSGKAPVKFPVFIGVGSLEYQVADWLFSFEYSRWHGKFESPITFLQRETVNERFYAMLSYRLAPWVATGAYYSALYPDVDKRSGRENYQHDVAMTMRFDINTNWLVKLEGHFMEGTADLSKELNDQQPLNSLHRNWGLFLLKTTAYF